ncbi:MAG: SelB C-terminal domain-containing protein, partial [Akkermansiaceae bacterium]
PDRRHFRNEDRQTFLTERAIDPHDLSQLLKTHLERDHFLSLDTLSAALPFTASEIKSALKKLTKANEIIVIGKTDFALTSFWKELSRKAITLVKGHHQAHPDLSGMSTDLLAEKLEHPACFDAVLGWLAENDFRVAENLVCHNDHALELPPELEAPAAEILRTLENAGLQPPLPGDLQPTANHEAAYRFLSRTKQIIPLDPKVTLSKSAYENALSLVRAHLEKVGQATASEIRQEIGTSRKVLMPLLERFDRDKVTRRDGDFRTLV